VNQDDVEWARPDLTESPDPVDAAVGWAVDIAHMAHVVWPAAIDGVLTPPPLEHVLDHLVRQEFGDSNSADVQAEFQLHAQAGTVAVVSEPRQCDSCASEGRGEVEARYDGPMGKDRRAPWGWMCADCYSRLSTGRLGKGEGEYLMRADEVPHDVWEACERAQKYWRDRGA